MPSWNERASAPLVLAADGARSCRRCDCSRAHSEIGCKTASAFYQLPIIKVPLQTIVGSVLSGGSAGIADPGEAAPMVRADIVAQSVERRKATAVVAMTQELLRQSTVAQSLISRFLSARVSEAVDRDAIGTVLLSGAASFTGTASVLNDVAKLLSAVGLTTQSWPVFVVSPSLAVSMAVLHTNNQRAFPDLNAYGGGEIYGIKTLISAGAPASSIVLLDCARIVGAAELPVTDISRQATLEMLDAPTSHAGRRESNRCHRSGSGVLVANRLVSLSARRATTARPSWM